MRMFEVDPLTFWPVDYVQYRTILGSGETPEWREVYRFTKEYEYENMDYKNFVELAQRLVKCYFLLE